MIRSFVILLYFAMLGAWPSVLMSDQVAIQLPGNEALKVIDDPNNPKGGPTSAAVVSGFQSALDAYRAQDFAAARDQWSALSDAGHAPSMHNQAVLLWRGQGGLQDQDAAVNLFRQSAVLENPLSLHALGIMRINGITMTKDVDKAIEHFDQASMLGYGPSIYNLAVMYWDGDLVEQDKTKALEYFEVAAESDYVRAQYDLAGLLYSGAAGEKNIEAARDWFGRAAENDDPFARYNLALMAIAGEGGPIDVELAYQQLLLSAEAGTIPAQMRLAAMLATGEHGSEADLSESLKWYLIADSFGADGASANIEMIERALKADQIALAKEKAVAFRPTETEQN